MAEVAPILLGEGGSAAAPASAPVPAPARRSRARHAVRAVLMLAAGVVLAVWGRALVDASLWTVGCGLAEAVLGVVGLGEVVRAIRPDADPATWLSGAWLGLLALSAAFADLLPLGNAADTTKTIGLAGFARPDLFSDHPLGTNGFGLDLLARCVYGARVSLLTVALTVVISIVVGGVVGMVAGYFRGWVDAVIGVFAEASLVIPALVLLIAVAAVLGPPDSVPEAIWKSGLALSLVGIPTMLRLARANTMVFAQREFVRASRILGARHSRVLRRDILPNVALPLLSYAFIVSAVLIVAEGSLAFLGLGLQQPEPTWGNMIAEGGLRDLRQHPHVPLVPGVFMFLTVFSLNVVGEKARARWEPRR